MRCELLCQSTSDAIVVIITLCPLYSHLEREGTPKPKTPRDPGEKAEDLQTPLREKHPISSISAMAMRFLSFMLVSCLPMSHGLVL